MSRSGVLVTGAAGYVGRLTVQALAARSAGTGPIVALDVRALPTASGAGPGSGTRAGPAGGPSAAVEHVRADITTDDIADVIGDRSIDTVVHLASIVRAPRHAPADLAYRVDVLGTRNVVEACIATGVKKLVVTTSGAAYGYHRDNPELIDEDDPLRAQPTIPYAHHKRLVEEMLAEYRHTHPALAQLVLRPGTVIGEGTRSPVTDLFEGPVVLGVRGSESPFVFIWDGDLVAVVVAGVLGEVTGIFNLAGEGALAPRAIAEVLHKPYLPLPPGLLRAGLGAARTLGLSPHGAPYVDFLRYRPVLSNRRLVEELGYSPVSSAEAFGIWARSRARRKARSAALPTETA